MLLFNEACHYGRQAIPSPSRSRDPVEPVSDYKTKKHTHTVPYEAFFLPTVFFLRHQLLPGDYYTTKGPPWSTYTRCGPKLVSGRLARSSRRFRCLSLKTCSPCHQFSFPTSPSPSPAHAPTPSPPSLALSVSRDHTPPSLALSVSRTPVE